jgi:hypothetical protein
MVKFHSRAIQGPAYGAACTNRVIETYMKTLLIGVALFIGQMNTRQDKRVVRLPPHRYSIEVGFGGQRLELINGPLTVNLPQAPPVLDSQGNPWSVDVKNLGPSVVTVVGKSQFSVHINVNQTVHIYSNGTGYFLKR